MTKSKFPGCLSMNIVMLSKGLFMLLKVHVFEVCEVVKLVLLLLLHQRWEDVHRL